MLVTSLSKSGIETYNDCPFKYYLQYDCRLSSPANKAAALGTCFHKIMELMAQCKQRNKMNTKIVTDHEWITRICYNKTVKDNPEFTFVEEDYETCLKWVKVILSSVRSPLAHKKILGVEQKFRYTLEKPGLNYINNDQTGFLAINGVIDLVVEVDKDTVEIIDYKTGKYIKDWNTGKNKTIDDFQKDLQLRLYNLVAKHMYPQYSKRILTLVYIQARKTFTVSMDLEDEINTIDVMRRHFRTMINDDKPMRIKEDATRSKERFKCYKTCYFGIAEIEGESICDLAHNMCKEYGHAGAKDFIKLTVNGQSTAVSKRKSFVDNKTITGVIK